MGRILPRTYDYAGVYMIRNRCNNKVYIGSSANIENRLQDHRAKLRKGIHPNKALQEDFNNHHTFQTHILYVEAIPRYSRQDRNKFYALEWKFIEKYNSIQTGYNKMPISEIRQKAL